MKPHGRLACATVVRRVLRVALALAFLLAVPAVARADSPPLDGETLTGAPADFQISPVDCAWDSPASFSFTGSGTASGPYPGTYISTVTGTIGPRNPFNSSLDVTWDETFTITSGTTTITGTKERIAPELSTLPQTEMGECDSFGNTSGDHGRLFDGQANLRYDATVHAPDGDTRYSGVGWSNVVDVRYCGGTPVDPVPFSNEGFFTSDPGASASPPAGAGTPVQGGPITCLNRPASVALEPPTATAVGTNLTLLATVTTTSGSAATAATVLFTIQGASATTGSCATSSSGQCAFTYEGPQAPGTDTITACADVNGNGTADADEPCATATADWVAAAADGDGDGDGVDDAIGTGSGGFLDAIPGQADTVGQIVAIDAGLAVEVSDAQDPEGVLVTVGAGSGRVTLSLCGGAFTARVYAGSAAVLTCGSLTERLASGHAEIVVGATVVAVPAGVTAKASANADGSFTVQNLGGGSITVTTNGVTRTVAAGTSTTVDTTPPVVTPVISGTLGTNGWYRSNVSVTWSVLDGQSAITRRTGCGASSVTNDTAGRTFTCTAVSGGGTTTATVTVRRDATAPAAAYAAHPAAYTVDQNVAFGCASSDAGSGVATACTGVNAAAWTFAPGRVTRSSTATDRAGNSRTATTAFTVGVTGGSLCNLTRQFVQGSGRYAASTRAQRATADLAAGVGCAALSSIRSSTPVTQRRALLATYRATVALLVSQGWLTAGQGGTLTTLSGAL